MLEKKLRTADIYRIAEQFRCAIVRAKRNGEFDFRDRMHNFPGGVVMMHVTSWLIICSVNMG